MNYRIFARGDWNAFFALMLDNMLNLVVLASILSKVFGFPLEFIYKYMIPGTALGVLFGDVAYTYMAVRLAKKTNKETTAMPLGLDTPSTIGIAMAILGPAFIGLKQDLVSQGLDIANATQQAAHGAWVVGMAVMWMMGIIKLLSSFLGETIRKHVPKAGLLGSLGGIGLALLSILPLIEMFKAPVIGLVCLGLIFYTLVAKCSLPYNIPGAAAAVLLGTILYYILGPLGLLGSLHFVMPKLEVHFALPIPTLIGFTSIPLAIKYLALAIPFGLLTIIGGINNTESAKVAGDDYSTRNILLVEAFATIIAGLFGGVVQSTPYIGHPAYKQMGASAGYTLATGLFVGLGGILGYVSFIVGALPIAAVVPILLFIGLNITEQAYHETEKKYSPAVTLAFLPIVMDLLLIRQDTLLGKLRGSIDAIAGTLGDNVKTIHAVISEVSLHVDAEIVRGLGQGFILTGMLWGSIGALIIDRKLLQAALFALISAFMTSFGFIHSVSPQGALYWPWEPYSAMGWHFTAGYLALSILISFLYLLESKKKY
ncbi:MAG: hypothetical protein HQK79_08375 [Desulfobacterales bacterium]|nr:hypothetical protein [Desulfobacterales bacterium]MBF0396644.1 hypothetical protein [Desulfobacterales bacterium]